MALSNASAYDISYIKIIKVGTKLAKIIIDSALDGSGSGGFPIAEIAYSVKGDGVLLYRHHEIMGGSKETSLSDGSLTRGYIKYDKWLDGSNVPFTSLSALITYLDSTIFA